ncbi:MAG: hypothetical protein MZV70_13655 [Desulfobacterales bacterium]|nr:hypothetical protein [Desulfobacterales bacterium]
MTSPECKERSPGIQKIRYDGVLRLSGIGRQDLSAPLGDRFATRARRPSPRKTSRKACLS